MDEEEKIIEFIKEKEGGFATVKCDKGGATNSGVTLTTFRQFYGQEMTVNDLKKMTEKQWKNIFEKGFYLKNNLDKINDFSIRFLITDFCWCSGNIAIKKLQRILGINCDGICGNNTISKINNYSNKMDLFANYKASRIQFFFNIIKAHPEQKKFLKGWINRTNSITYEG
jgi:lysozyme family protein